MNDPGILCRLDEITAHGSRGFSLEGREIFVVRGADGVRAYENSCPHTGGMLDWVEDQFLSYERTHILCATHGAQFRMSDGHCIFGPCIGKALTAVAIRIEGEHIVLVD